MEASKCPKCGDEPFFIEHVEKWYCYGCNSYVEDEVPHAEPSPAVEQPKEDKAAAIAKELQAMEHEPNVECKNCGAELEDLKDGKLYCFVCETYQDEIKPEPEQKPEVNDAQKLLDLSPPVAVPPKVPEAPVHAPVPVPEAKPEPGPPVVEVMKAPEPRVEPEVKAEKPSDIKMCPTCGQPMKFIDKYARHYCYGCRKYAPKEEHAKAVEAPRPAPNGGKKCPDCGSDLKFIEKYREHYCYSCKKYPLTVQKKAQPQEAVAPEPKVLTCPKCSEPLKWVEKYGRHYCYKCKEYAPKGYGGVAADAEEKKECPACDEAMKYIPEYNEWYCFKCKKYSLRPSKPVLLF